MVKNGPNRFYFVKECFLCSWAFICLICGVSSGLSLPAIAAETEGKASHVLNDEAAKDPSFASFRASLLEAAKQKDKSYLESVISQDIWTGLGTGKGKDLFMEEWKQLRPDSPFWKRLERVLAHGSEYDEESKEFHSPAVSFADNHSSLVQAIVWNRQSAIYGTANESAKLKRAVYAEQVSLLDSAEKLPLQKKWVKVKLQDGFSGFMKADDLYSAYDEFALFKKISGRWLLVWFGYAAY